jgi:hypothetical protein
VVALTNGIDDIQPGVTHIEAIMKLAVKRYRDKYQ